MKKLKYFFGAVFILILLLGLWKKSGSSEFTQTEFLFDTNCSVTFYGKDAKEAAKAVFSRLDEIDALMDMYSETSDVARINRAAAFEKVKISRDTAKVISAALRISEMSGGAFDITVASLKRIWNFEAENPRIPSDEEIETVKDFVGYKNIILDSEKLTVSKKFDKVEIDLGGAAKGYAADEAAKIAKKYNLSGGIIDLGGNILCFGKNPKSENGKWKIGVQKPFEPTGTYERIIETDGSAVVTSGIYQRYFKSDGKIYHHILDPKTGKPKNAKYEGVTIEMKSALYADCLATAVYVMGERGKELVEEMGGRCYIY